MESYVSKKEVIKLILKKAIFVYAFIMAIIIAAMFIAIGLIMIKMEAILGGFLFFTLGTFCMCVVITSVFAYEKLL